MILDDISTEVLIKMRGARVGTARPSGRVPAPPVPSNGSRALPICRGGRPQNLHWGCLAGSAGFNMLVAFHGYAVRVAHRIAKRRDVPVLGVADGWAPPPRPVYEANNVGGFGRKVRVVALAPGFASLKINLVAA
jgi:hypothetical protein